jgi:choline dehydrogenase-like flavoprotein
MKVRDDSRGDRDPAAIPDFAIIGSVVSGGRMACELTAAGARRLLLEAGLWPPGPWAAMLRVVRIGLRRVVLSLYDSGGAGPSYDGPGPLDVLASRVAVAVEDGRRPVLETSMEM